MRSTQYRNNATALGAMEETVETAVMVEQRAVMAEMEGTAATPAQSRLLQHQQPTRLQMRSPPGETAESAVQLELVEAQTAYLVSVAMAERRMRIATFSVPLAPCYLIHKQ